MCSIFHRMWHFISLCCSDENKTYFQLHVIFICWTFWWHEKYWGIWISGYPKKGWNCLIGCDWLKDELINILRKWLGKWETESLLPFRNTFRVNLSRTAKPSMCPLSVDGRNRKSTFDTETKMRQSIYFGLAGISSDHNIYCDRDQRLFVCMWQRSRTYWWFFQSVKQMIYYWESSESCSYLW